MFDVRNFGCRGDQIEQQLAVLCAQAKDGDARGVERLSELLGGFFGSRGASR